MKKYQVVVADTLEELQDKVTALMNQYLSWTPIGGVMVNNGQYLQAMIY